MLWNLDRARRHRSPGRASHLAGDHPPKISAETSWDATPRRFCRLDALCEPLSRLRSICARVCKVGRTFLDLTDTLGQACRTGGGEPFAGSIRLSAENVRPKSPPLHLLHKFQEQSLAVTGILHSSRYLYFSRIHPPPESGRREGDRCGWVSFSHPIPLRQRWVSPYSKGEVTRPGCFQWHEAFGFRTVAH